MLYTELRLKRMTLMWITVMLFKKTDSAQTIGVHQPDGMITAGVGDNVTLHCFSLGDETPETVIWYKQKVGHEPCLMVTVLNKPAYEDGFKSPRYSMETSKGSWHLNIANLEPADEAVYYCGLMKFLKMFGKGTYLSVQGDGDIQVSVFQSSTMDSVPAGASVTLQCSVLSESRTAELQVLWFRASPQSHPQIISTHHNSSHQCERSSSTHTCVYNFSKNISRSDPGTYYCAVAVCGKIIFGNGTRVQKERSEDPVIIYLAVSVGVCVLLIFALIVVIIYKSSNCEQHKMSPKQGSLTDQTLDKDGDNVELNYAAFRFNERRAKGGRVQKQQPQDVIYSDVRGLSIS